MIKMRKISLLAKRKFEPIFFQVLWQFLETAGRLAVAGARKLHPPPSKSVRILSNAHRQFGNGGESGIRTHGAVARTTVFETVQFNHSCISPQVQRRSWKKD